MYDETIINDHFNLPISYLNKKEMLDKNIVRDLELTEVHNEDCSICLSSFDIGEMLITLPCDKKSKRRRLSAPQNTMSRTTDERTNARRLSNAQSLNGENDSMIGRTSRLNSTESVGTTDTIKTKRGHSFHAACIREWLKRQNSCPLCQKLV